MRGALGLGGTLLRSPRGCGEQALMALAPRAAALRYLDHSGGWGGLPPDSRSRGLRGLRTGTGGLGGGGWAMGWGGYGVGGEL